MSSTDRGDRPGRLCIRQTVPHETVSWLYVMEIKERGLRDRRDARESILRQVIFSAWTIQLLSVQSYHRCRPERME